MIDYIQEFHPINLSLIFQFQFSLLVKLLDCSLIVFSGLEALQLHSVGHYPQSGEQLFLKMYVLGVLKAMKPIFLAQIVQLSGQVCSQLYA